MRQRVVTDTDIALLRGIAKERSVVAASRSEGVSRDRAKYRLARLAQVLGGPVVTSVRGGRTFGASRLTPLGERIARRGFDSIELAETRRTASLSRANLVTGTYRRHPTPHVAVGRGVRLQVSFSAREGESVAVRVGPEAILVARGKFVSSARNVIRAVIEVVEAGSGSLESVLVARVGGVHLRVGVTKRSIRELRLTPGERVWLYVKATSIRRANPGRSRHG